MYINKSLATSGETLVFNNECELLWSEYIPDPRFLLLNQTVGGTIGSDKLSGYDGDIVTLSNTASASYTFSSYSLTGAVLTGSQFAFAGSNVTAQAYFRPETLATGVFTARTKHDVYTPNKTTLYYCSDLQNAAAGKVYVTANQCPSWITAYADIYMCLCPTGYFTDTGGAGTASPLQPTALHLTAHSVGNWMHLTGETTQSMFYICQNDYFGNYAIPGNYEVK